MGLLKRIKEVFASTLTLSGYSGSAVNSAAANDLNNGYARWLIKETDWEEVPEEEIFEHMYIWESQVGPVVEKVGNMVGQAFKGFTYMDPSKVYSPDGKDPEKELLEEMVKAANYHGMEHDMNGAIRTYGEMTHMFGNVYIHEVPEDLSLEILPNIKVTLLDDLERIMNPGVDISKMIITQANYIVVDEGIPGLQKDYSKDECYIIKIRGIPLNLYDSRGRQTFGLYAVSPLQRAILPVWQSRIIRVLDIIWRWANVPRDHHQLNSEMYDLINFPVGTPQERLEEAAKAAKTDCETYAKSISGKAPGHDIVTTDAVAISPIEHTTATYMAPNDLLKQAEAQIWDSHGIPKSVVTGVSDSSYASEVLISNYTAGVIVQMTEIVSKPLVENMRKRLLRLYPDKHFPVKYLTAKIDYTLAATEIDNVKKSVAMGGSELYTYDECRDETGHSPLKKEDYNKIVRKGVRLDDKGEYEEPEPEVYQAGTGKKVSGSATKYPDTPHSRESRPTGVGMSNAEKSTS